MLEDVPAVLPMLFHRVHAAAAPDPNFVGVAKDGLNLSGGHRAQLAVEFSASHSSSESRRAIQVPVAARIPAFRAALTPRFSCSIKRTPGNSARTRSAVSSVEPSSTTRISSGGRVWRRMDSSARVMTLARLNVGMTTETVAVLSVLVIDTAVRVDGEGEYEVVVPSGQCDVVRDDTWVVATERSGNTDRLSADGDVLEERRPASFTR